MDPSQQLVADVYDDEAFVDIDGEDVIGGTVVDDLHGDDNAVREDEEEEQADAEAQLEAVPEEEELAVPRLPDTSVKQFCRHSDAVMALSWCRSNPGRIASAGCDDKAFLWQLRGDESQVVELSGHEDTVASVSFDPSGEFVATGGMDGVIKVWEVATGKVRKALEGPVEAVEWLEWHPKGTVLLAGSEDLTAWMFNALQGQCMQVFSGHCGSVTAGGFTPDGKAVITAGGDGDSSIRTWDPKSGTCSAVLNAGYGAHAADGGVTCMAFAADGSVVATGAVDGTVVVSNCATCRAVARSQEHEGSVEGLAWANGLPLLVSAGMDGKAVIWEAGAGAVRGRCTHGDGITAVAMQHAGPLFATGGVDGVVRVWDVRSAALVRECGGHSAAVQSLAWSWDDACVASGGDDCTVRVFEVA